MKRLLIVLLFFSFTVNATVLTYGGLNADNPHLCAGTWKDEKSLETCIEGGTEKGQRIYNVTARNGTVTGAWYDIYGQASGWSDAYSQYAECEAPAEFNSIGECEKPEIPFCDLPSVKSAIAAAETQCYTSNNVEFSSQCDNETETLTTNCNPVGGSCVGLDCGSGTGGDGGSSGSGGSSSGGGTSTGGDGSGSGSKGEKGDKGDKGDTGEAGKDGVDGIDGTNGIDGINGTAGIDGTNGTNGSDGRDGVNGSNGNNGVDGERGASGKNGIDGINGLNGLDAEPADLRPVLNSISSLKSFNANEFNSAAASRGNLRSSLDSISALTSGLGGNIDALKTSNKNALSDIKNTADSLGAKSDEQTAYQKIIADKMAELSDSFGVGIPELDKKSERNNNLLDDIKRLTQTSTDELTAANKAQLDKAFAQFDETKKQTDLLANIEELTAGLGDNSVTDNELKSVNDKLAQMNNQLGSGNNKLDTINETLIVNESQSSKRTDQLLAALANSDAQGESRWRELRDQYKQGSDDLVDAVGGVGDGIEGAIGEQTDRLLETGLTGGGVNSTADKTNGIVDGIMDDALGQYVEAIESSTDDIALNESSFSVLQDRFNALVGVNSTCVSMKFGLLNVTCEASDRFKQYFGFILYFFTMMTLYDILFTGITPNPATAPGRKRF
jgi:Collagen triple helix repeat (20 copies)